MHFEKTAVYEEDGPCRYVVYSCKGGDCNCGLPQFMCGAADKGFIEFNIKFDAEDSPENDEGPGHNDVCVAEFEAPNFDAAKHIMNFLSGFIRMPKKNGRS